MFATAEGEVVYRVGRAPDPVAFPPFEAVGTGRFDDPRRQYRILYTAEAPIAAFLESLAPFRTPVHDLLPLMQRLTGDREPVIGRIPTNWHLKRMLAEIGLYPGQRWLDLRSAETHTRLTAEFAEPLAALGYDVLDARVTVGLDRPLTQAISRWAYEHGYQGIAYTSRIDTRFTCLAIFEGAHLVVNRISMIPSNHADLVAAARSLNLQLSA